MDLVWLPYEKRLKYPHLRDAEVLIWDRFIEKYPEIFEEVAYDVRVGTPRSYPESLLPSVRKAMEYLSLKRIDVVGKKKNNIYVIEIEPNASMFGIGQVLGVTQLFKEKYPNFRSYNPVLITDIENPDIKKLCDRFFIRYFVV